MAASAAERVVSTTWSQGCAHQRARAVAHCACSVCEGEQLETMSSQLSSRPSFLLPTTRSPLGLHRQGVPPGRIRQERPTCGARRYPRAHGVVLLAVVGQTDCGRLWGTTFPALPGRTAIIAQARSSDERICNSASSTTPTRAWQAPCLSGSELANTTSSPMPGGISPSWPDNRGNLDECRASLERALGVAQHTNEPWRAHSESRVQLDLGYLALEQPSKPSQLPQPSSSASATTCGGHWP